MTFQLEYGTLSSPEDAQQLGVIISQCFNDQSPNGWQTYTNGIGLENFRIIRKAGQIIGGLSIYHMGQWYGSRSIPMAGIASVGISPEHRGTGAAVELMTYMLKELHAKGVPLSTLYAATQRPYRRVGYEQGGTLCTWEIPTSSIQVRSSILPMQSVSPDHHQFQDLYYQQAKVTNGYLDRNQAIWQRIESQPNNEAVYAYSIGSETQPEGYIIFTQRQEDNSCVILS